MIQKKIQIISLFCFTILFQFGMAQNTSNHGNKFEQLDQILATPNDYRAMDGSPGHEYWQQKVDYDIE